MKSSLIKPALFSLLLATAFSFSSARAQGPALTHGPVVGGVTPSAAQVFLRTNQVATVAIRYGTDPSLQSFATSAAFQTAAANDFTKTIPLTNLTPETTYYLTVLVNGLAQDVAPYPTFKTFAGPDTSRDFKFVILTDFITVKNLQNNVQTFNSAAAESPAFVFLGGDFDHRNPVNIFAKRKMFQDLYDPATPFMADFASKILRQFALAHQWDDHDAGWNNIDKNYANWGISQQVFQEYVPTYPLPGITPGIWQEFRYAQADFFVLDCRSQRDDENDTDDANKSMLDGNALGATGQLEWLKQGLLHSTAKWKIVFTSVVTNPTTKFPDGWAGYQTGWNALRDFVAQHQIHNIVFISGDLHLAAIDDGRASGFPEMCAPQANGGRNDGFCATDYEGVWSQGYFNATCPGYDMVTVLQNPDRLLLQTADEFGAVHLSYTVASTEPTPTPTPSPTPTPTPTVTPTPAPPIITAQPKSVTVKAGETATFTVRATGDAPLNYQWLKDGAAISGANSASYTTPPTTIGDSGSLFSVVVSNPGGSVTSNSPKLTVQAAPAITVEPQDKSVQVGKAAKFTVSVAGSKPLSYQWMRNGAPIAGATSSSYKIEVVTNEDNGATFSVTIANDFGNAVSRNALLTVR